MWKRKFALSLVLCVLLQPVSIFAGQINRTEEAFAATAYNGVNFSYNLVVSETDAKITVGAIGGCGVEEIEAHVEMQKESAQGWTGCADWRYVQQGMRLSGEEHCLVELGMLHMRIHRRQGRPTYRTGHGVRMSAGWAMCCISTTVLTMSDT